MKSTGRAQRPIRACKKALGVERRTVIELRNRHVINDEVMRRIEHELDLLEDRLRHVRGG